MTDYIPIDNDEARSLLGEGIHTGLRKGGEADDAHDIWKAISTSDTSAWSDAIAFAIGGLESMGYVLCKKEES